MLYTPTKVTPMNKIKIRGTQWKLFKKIDENKYNGPFWPYLGPKRPENLVHMGRFSHTPESTRNMHLNQISWSHIKSFLRKQPKTSKISILPIFVSKDPLKIIGSKKSKFDLNNFGGNIVVHIQAKYRKDWMKTQGAYSTWKKGWQTEGRTDRQTDGSASDKLNWLCEQWS